MSKPNDWIHRKQISTTDINSPTHSCGRTPWYGHASPESKRRKRTFLIGVAGGTASGKTSVCRAVVDHLQLPWVQILSMDCFYRGLTDEERSDTKGYNFDHPNAFDWELLLNVLKELKQGKAVKCPQYDFTTHSRKKEFTLMYGADVVLCEGILILHDPKILEQFDVKVFVKTDDDIRLIRRIKRDMANRGRTLDSVLAQYQETVKPSYHTFCEPTQSAADVVIPRGRDNVVAIQLLCDHIKNKLIEGGNVDPVFYKSDRQSASNGLSPVIPSNVLVPEHDDQVLSAVEELHCDQVEGKRLLQTIGVLCTKLLTLCLHDFMPRRFFTPSPTPRPHPIKFDAELKAEEEAEIIMFVDEQDEDGEELKELGYTEEMATCTDSDDFNNGMTVHDISEQLTNGDKVTALNGTRQSLDGSGNLPFDQDQVMDDGQVMAMGNLVDDRKQSVCVVTIFSGGMLFGETIMEQIGNNKSFKVDWGSIHIFHESKKPAKPRFYDRQLPLNIIDQKVIMVDAFIGTGNRARMAIQVILDHHVPQQNICYITLESSARGIINLAKVFPNVQFITARIGNRKNDKHWETVPETSSLVIKYCKAAGIDIVDDEVEAPSGVMSPVKEDRATSLPVMTH